MKYLIDTHVILWWLTEPQKLTDKAYQTISNKENALFVSSVSFWEMAIKKDIGKLNIPINVLEILLSENFQILPLHAEEALGVVDLPKIHTDPFDRVLISQAKYNDMVFITKDCKVLDYPIVTMQA